MKVPNAIYHKKRPHNFQRCYQQKPKQCHCLARVVFRVHFIGISDCHKFQSYQIGLCKNATIKDKKQDLATFKKAISGNTFVPNRLFPVYQFHDFFLNFKISPEWLNNRKSAKLVLPDGDSSRKSPKIVNFIDILAFFGNFWQTIIWQL